MAGDCMIEWHIDWEAFERYPKHKQEEILSCEHDWHDYDNETYTTKWNDELGIEIIYGAYSECLKCNCPRHEVIA